jgi:hypothetical protein
MLRRTTRLAIAAVVGAVLLAAAPAAHAKEADVIRRSACSGSSDWKFKASPEDGRIEVEFEVDSNVNGQAWRVLIWLDGDRIFAGTRTTRPPAARWRFGAWRVTRPVRTASAGAR